MRYAIVSERATSNYAAYVPSLSLHCPRVSPLKKQSLIREAIDPSECLRGDGLRTGSQPRQHINARVCAE